MEHETQAQGGSSLSSAAAIALIRKIQGGDQSALAILYDETSRLLFGLCLKVLGDRALAEETLLDTYTRIWRQSASYDPGLLPLEWLIAVARACAVARLHWSKRDKGRWEPPAGNLDPTITVAPEQQNLARSAIESLVPLQREILESVCYSGLSCSEVATQIGKPLGAVKIHARLGLSKLSDLFRPMIEREMEAGTATGGHLEARSSD